MQHRMAQQAAQAVQSQLQPIGTPTAVQRVAPSVPMQPGAPIPPQPGAPLQPPVAPQMSANPLPPGAIPPQGQVVQQGYLQAPVQQMGNYVETPASVQQMMDSASQDLHPNSVGDRINDQQIQQMLQESERRTAELAGAVQANQQQMQTHLQQQAEYQRQQAEAAQAQLELQRQALEQQQRAPEIPLEEQYALSETERQTFSESLPVIDKRAQLAAQQAVQQAINNQAEDPRVAQLQQEVNSLRQQAEAFSTYTSDHFEAQVRGAAAENEINLDTVINTPAWQQLMVESQQTIPGTRVGSTFGEVVRAALDGKTAQDALALNEVFKTFKARSQGQPNLTAQPGVIPQAGGQVRSSPAGLPAAEAIQTELAQIQQREATLRDHLQRGKRLPSGEAVTNETFMKEMGALETRREELLQQLQPQG